MVGTSSQRAKAKQKVPATRQERTPKSRVDPEGERSAMAQPEGADGSDQVEQVKVYENSYRMEPNNRYSAEVVDKIIFEVMNLQLEDFVYDPEVHNGANLCSDIAAEIRKRILKKKFDRYKVVVGVSIVERQSQTFESVLGFLWDVSRDNYSTYTYTSKTFSATCFVVGAYYE